MTDPVPLTPFERYLLAELAADGDHPPAALALALDADLKTVLDTAVALQKRGLVVRHAFDTCQLTDRGRTLVKKSVDASGPSLQR